MWKMFGLPGEEFRRRTSKMVFRDHQLGTVRTITAAVVAAGITAAAWKTYRRGSHRRVAFSLLYAGSRCSLPALYDHSLSAVHKIGTKYPKVFSIGGHGMVAEYMEVWVLDSVLSRWSEILPVANADAQKAVFVKRSCHASAGIGSDIYVIGGYTNKTLGDLLKFDTIKERWSLPFFSGIYPQPRSSHSVTVVGKKVYLFGGYGESSPLNDVHILHTEEGSWTQPTVMGVPPAPRCAHSAVLLQCGERILIYGGYTSSAESDIWFLEIDTPYVRRQRERLGTETVAWSKGSVGKSPQPVVLCGPSGVGKSTLIGKLMKEYPNQFGFSVSHTTRGPRTMEEDGVHYHFTSRAQMEADLREGKFLESAEVHGQLYGTSIAAVEAVIDAGQTCILDIDLQGAELVKDGPLDALFIFISPPTFKELESRLRGRGTETEEQIQQRLTAARVEMGRSNDDALFDHMVINDDIDDAHEQLKKLLGLHTAGSETTCPDQHPEARSGHSSSVLGSKVLIYGGLTNRGAATNDLCILDTASLTMGAPAMTRGLTWSQPEPKFDFWKYLNQSPSLTPRYSHRAIPVSSTEILLTGGYNGKQSLNESIILKVEER